MGAVKMLIELRTYWVQEIQHPSSVDISCFSIQTYVGSFVTEHDTIMVIRNYKLLRKIQYIYNSSNPEGEKDPRITNWYLSWIRKVVVVPRTRCIRQSKRQEFTLRSKIPTPIMATPVSAEVSRSTDKAAISEPYEDNMKKREKLQNELLRKRLQRTKNRKTKKRANLQSKRPRRPKYIKPKRPPPLRETGLEEPMPVSEDPNQDIHEKSSSKHEDIKRDMVVKANKESGLLILKPNASNKSIKVRRLKSQLELLRIRRQNVITNQLRNRALNWTTPVITKSKGKKDDAPAEKSSVLSKESSDEAMDIEYCLTTSHGSRINVNLRQKLPPLEGEPNLWRNYSGNDMYFNEQYSLL